ncbi:GENERAL TRANSCRIPTION FACTOR 3C POLYPEPTIDE 4 FAMILY [Salix purpurea]|uniref:GENERAL TRANSCRIPTION FACTOR 3C POLYPEPTIDE 4 FAMILY n=1 Tax=Salix purpurea TaxID=77065 RepID=A0A9Q0W5T5_SALPP|nr:GENERAL TRANSCRIPTION FACTOR 3C POLYPEPTIDE 4 FAMILY [Salix purpurea]
MLCSLHYLETDRSCVRSISWSPIGMAPNYGCLFAICTVEGRVKIYRPPFCDFSAEWVEVVDIATTMKLSSDQAMEFGYDGDATAWNRDTIGVD